MKKCTKCGLVKEESEYYKNEQRTNNFHTHCKTCMNQYSNTRLNYKYAHDPEFRKEVKRRNKVWYQKHK